MRLGSRLTIGLLSVLVAVGLGAPAEAVDPAPTTLRLTATAAYADASSLLRVDLVDQAGKPVAGAVVTLVRRTTGATVATLTTDDAGHAERRLRARRSPADNRFDASYAGDGVTYGPSKGVVSIPLKRRASTVVVSGPGRVVDEQRVPVRIRWTTSNRQPVAGTVRVDRALGGGRWKRFATVHTDSDGRAQVVSAPRSDSRWRATGVGQAWVSGDRSGVHRVDNLPPGRRVGLPAKAPRPRRKLPAQGHAVGAGPNVAVTAIPGGTWSQMTGRTWHRGCPVGRAQLRLVRVNYWDYTGYRRRGELVANADAAGAMGAALAEMYRHKLPIRGMYRVDRFGYSRRSHGGNDYASMAAGNTSAFNCRDVTGRPGVRSPHSYGRSLDVNTWENPYRSARGLVPNTWWQHHSHPRVAWRSRSHPVVRIMARHGLRWTYGLGDTQHFDYVGSRARAAVQPMRCDRYCD